MVRRQFAAVASCLLVSAVLLQANVFGRFAKGLTWTFGGGDEAAALKSYHRDTRTQEWSNGENPLPQLRELGRYWHREHHGRRVVFIGNSQTFSVILAPDERDPGVPVMTYVDRIGQRFVAGRAQAGVYRLSAPNLSYAEALWYVTYLAQVDEVRPTDVVLQLNYESFRKGGIRDGMLELLKEERFAAEARRIAARETLFGASFAQAIRRFEELERKQVTQMDKRSDGGMTEAFGERVERELRRKMDEVGIGKRKHTAKAEFLNVLYLLRVYLLQITPSTPRPLAGAAYEGSVSALHEIAEKCRGVGISLRLFLAPQNPKVRMWRTEADRERYRSAAQLLKEKYKLPLVDLEDRIPPEQWGVWVDGPDPIHFGLRGHETMAEAIMSGGLL